MVSDAMTLRGDPETVIAALHAEATRLTGLSDFGPPDYLEPLRMIVAEVEGADLTEIGRPWFRGDLLNLLVGRLVRERAWKDHPEHRDRHIERPVVICGVARTGTTALHKVMSLDPQFQGLDHWLTRWPIPRPPRAQWAGELGYQRAAAHLDRLFELVPALRGQHDISVDELDECIEVLRLEFASNHFPSSYDVPAFYRWFRDYDETPLYHRLADTIRLIGLHDDRTWLLKNPGHLAQLSALLAVFPDSRVIVTHRDPAKSIASLASLLSGLRRLVYRDADLTVIGPRELDYYSRAQAHTEAVRAGLPAEQFIDIDHGDFHRDPIGTVRRIYDQFGLVLTAEVEQAMRDWLAANPADKHGAHRYDIEDYGITTQQVHAVMGTR